MDNSIDFKRHAFFWIGIPLILGMVTAFLFARGHYDYRDIIVSAYAVFSRMMWIMLPGVVVYYLCYFFVFPAEKKAKVKMLLRAGAIAIIILLIEPIGFMGMYLMSLLPNVIVLSFFFPAQLLLLFYEAGKGAKRTE